LGINIGSARGFLGTYDFFAKNDMIDPCPAFAAGFFGFAAPEDAGFDFGAGSSSEKDSHTASSRVTGLMLAYSFNSENS
jgi:hypothetical protein